ncbi:MAG: MBL fold metallo-hydrolase [Halobacteriovoraceae bacterium]|nr:MBL fold metallo-hydrolase [Halobacteriovoraceae bacterium]
MLTLESAPCVAGILVERDNGKMKIHSIKGYICMIYLVEYDQGLLLLDSGCRVDVPVVKAFIENELNRPFSDLSLVLVSHAHPDHSGGASTYKKLGIKVAGPIASNNWYSGLGGIAKYMIDILLTYYVAYKIRQKNLYQFIFFKRKVDFDYPLEEGQLIPGFGEWKVVSAPGHTSSDLSFFHEGTKTAYVADNLILTGRGVIAPYPITLPPSYRESLAKYLKLGVEEFLMAHYGRQKIPHEKIEKIISKVKDTPRIHRTTLPRMVKKLLKF